MIKKYYIILLLIFGVHTAFCQSKIEVANNILTQRNEIIFRFYAEKSELKNFSEIVSIDSYDGKMLTAYSNSKEFEKFLETGKEFEILDEKSNFLKSLNVATTINEMQNWDKYPSYEVYIEMMKNFANNNPSICRLDTIGFSVQNRLLLAVKISDNVADEEIEPEFFYSGQIHGDELVCGFLLLRLIDYLLGEYGINEQVTKLVDNLQIYINPLANPDGMYLFGNSDVELSTRYNANSVDLNRNFPRIDNEATSIQPEIAAMIDYAAVRNFVMSSNLHSGAELVNYPFDALSEYPADYSWWELVSREYATNAQNASQSNNYFTDRENGVSNGFDWYCITGSRQDYMNYFHHCREVTLELSTTKKINSDSLVRFWDYNKKALLDYMQQATYGLRGIITDSITGEPLVARVFIENYDKLNSYVYSFAQHGDYYRYLFRGDYELTFSANGYQPKTFSVSIQNYEQQMLDVQLIPIENTMPIADFDYEIIDKSVNFINKSFAAESFTWDFGDNVNSNAADPFHLYENYGKYTVSLIAENDLASHQISKEITIGNDLENHSINSIKLYPNPVEKMLYVGSELSVKRIIISDISGKILIDVVPDSDLVEIDVEKLKFGVYFVGIQTCDKFISEKIVKIQ
ncbi:T9SS type A sorting domain-containing protein [Bacteroidales bacterium OttesenSCG-928-I21]|nr:T9SS type A sorting domain-containing protein [Bacteroidales bacterium OttesenSCG-928-I21]